ncbi:MAG: PAS domain S-box protein [Armatimonadota bacterium]
MARASAALAVSTDEAEIARVIVAAATELDAADTALLLVEGEGARLRSLAVAGECAPSIPAGGLPRPEAEPSALRKRLGVRPRDGFRCRPLPGRRRGLLVVHRASSRSGPAGAGGRTSPWMEAVWTTLLEQAAAALDRADRVPVPQFPDDPAVPVPSDPQISLLMEAVPDALIILGRDQRVRRVNSHAERLFGYDRSELVGETLERLIPERFRRGQAARIASYFENPRPRQMGAGEELFVLRRDGTEIPVEISLSPLQTPIGLVAVCAVRDATAWKLAQEAIRNSEAHFLTAFEQSPIPVSLVDLDGCLLRVNRSFCRFSGRSEGELIGRRVLDLLHPQDEDAEGEAVAALLSGRATLVTLERRYPRPDGSMRWGQVSISLVRDSAGAPLHFVRQILDITDYRRSREELRASERFSQAVLESLPAQIVVLDGEGRIVRTNPAWERFSRENGGDPARAGAGISYLEVCRAAVAAGEARAGEVLEGLQSVLRGETSEFQMEYSCPNGEEERWLLVRAAPLPLERGGVVVSHFDVTALHLAERTLTEAAERRSEQLSLAVREAHHRIKNNLQAVTDLLSLELHTLGSVPGAASLQASIDRIQAISLVHDLLSRESGMELVDLRQIVERLAPAALRASARAEVEIELRLDVASHLLTSRKATAVALILNELINNAAKHAFSGRRSGRLEIRTVETHPGWLVLTIEDDGPGLPADFDLGRHGGVGLQVVQTLVEGTLEGTLALTPGSGLRVDLRLTAEGGDR